MRFHIPAPSVEQARHIVLNYSRRMASIKWTCREDMDYTKEKSYTSKLKYTAGETYYGPIYVSNGRNMDKFLLSLDENGVYTVSAEVFGKGVDMWLKSQGEFIKIF